MAKHRTMATGNGVIGPTGADYRNLINDSIPNDTYTVPSTFVWTGDLTAYANMVLLITYAYALGSSNVNLPAGCTLKFEGGSIATTGNIVGNNSRVINESSQPCFSTGVNFTGTWSETTCNFQWFGAKSVPTNSTYTNECSAAINKAVNSPFEVVPIPGFYYVTSPIVFTKPKSIFMGVSVVENTGDGSLISAMIPDHVRFFTNQDINVLDIQSSNLHLIGGVVDVRNVTGAYTKDAIGIHNIRLAGNVSVKILKGTIQMGVVGSKAGTLTLGASGKAFHWSMDGNLDYACMHQMRVDLYVTCIPYGIYIDDDSTGHPDTNQGSNYFYCIADGCKQGFHVESGFHNTFVGFTQTRGVLDYTEQDMYQAEFNGANILDIFNWDLTARDYYLGGYYPSRGTLLKGNKNDLVGASLKNLSIVYENAAYRPASVFPVTHQSKVAILNQKLNRTNFISELNNMLIGWNKKGTVTVKGHNGSAIDFDSLTPTIGSEAETANITTTNAHSLFLLKGYTTYYAFNASADIDKDFIEIALTNRNIRGLNAYINLSASSGGPKRIQIIGFKSVGNPDVFDNLAPADSVGGEKTYTFALSSNTTYTSMAIRLIGCPSVRKAATINVANPAVITSAAHGFSNLALINFATTGTLPAPLLPNVNYYLRAIDANSFNLSSTSNGALIQTTSAGSGTHSFIDTQYIYLNDIAVEPDNTLEGQNFVPNTSFPKAVFHGWLNQSGVANGVVTSFLNSFVNSANLIIEPTLIRQATPGVYHFIMSYAFTVNKTIPKTKYIVYTDLGRIEVTLSDDSHYIINTFNTSDVLSDGILVDFPMFVNSYW